MAKTAFAKTLEGHGFSRAESVPPGTGFSPCQPRLKPFQMEFDFAALKPGASTGLYSVPD
jgi:hypothetical protein